MSPDGASRVTFGGLLRAVDDGTPDPKVRVLRERVVAAARWARPTRFARRSTTRWRPRCACGSCPSSPLCMEVKAGAPAPRDWSVVAAARRRRPVHRLLRRALVLRLRPGRRARARGRAARARVARAGGSRARTPRRRGRCRSRTRRSWCRARRARCAQGGRRRRPAPGEDPRIARWLDAALDDLDALRLALPAQPDDEFYAAGAPWFLTLFGRDSLWAARLALPVDRRIAASTLRVLARLQGDATDVDSAEQPGKILHELRGAPLEMPGEGITLPPVYYGTVDATALWVCLLADAHAAGMPDDEVRGAAARAAAGARLAAERRHGRRRVHRLHRRDRPRAHEPGLEGLGRFDPVALRASSRRGRSPCARCRATRTRRRSRARSCSTASGNRGRRAPRTGRRA